ETRAESGSRRRRIEAKPQLRVQVFRMAGQSDLDRLPGSADHVVHARNLLLESPMGRFASCRRDLFCCCRSLDSLDLAPAAQITDLLRTVPWCDRVVDIDCTLA